MSDAVGRSGFDVLHTKSGAATRGNRETILGESMRELSEKTARKWAARNDLIVPEDTHLNEAYVADGQGGYRRTREIAEVLDYGDARRERLTYKLRPADTALTQIVAHLPKSMCDEQAGFYPPSATSKSKQRRPRYTAKDRDEARAYFMDVIEYIRDNVLTDRDAIHGFDINFDETTPHVQILLDPFGRDVNSDDPDALRIDKNRVFGSHEDVRYTEGEKKGQKKGGPVKMREYQAGLREAMADKGWPIELDADPVRRRRKESKSEFEESQALLADIQAAQAKLDAERRELDEERRKLEKDRAALPALKEAAEVEGFNKGWDEATHEADKQIAEARAKVLADAQDDGAVMAAELRENAAQEALRAAQTAERSDIGVWLRENRPDVLEAYEESLKPKRGPRKPGLLFTSRLQGDERKGRELIVRLVQTVEDGRAQAVVELNADDPVAAKQTGLVLSGRWSSEREKLFVGTLLPAGVGDAIKRAAGSNVVGDAYGVRADLLPPMDSGQGLSIKPGSVQPSQLRLVANWREKQQDCEERGAAAKRRLKDFTIDGVPRRQRDEDRGLGL